MKIFPTRIILRHEKDTAIIDNFINIHKAPSLLMGEDRGKEDYSPFASGGQTRRCGGIFIIVFICLQLFFLLPVTAGQKSDISRGGNSPPEKLPISIRDGRVTMDLKDAQISHVFKALSQKAGFRMAANEGISGKVSIRVSDRPLENVIRLLCANRAIVYQYLPDTKTFKVAYAGLFASSTAKNPKTTTGGSQKPSTQNNSRNYTSGGTASGKASASTEKSKRSAPEVDHKGRPLYKTGELLIRFSPHATKSDSGKLHSFLGSVVIRTISPLGIQQVKLIQGWDENEAMAAYRASGIVDHVERHALRYVNGTTPDDPNYASSWWLQKMQASKAWDITTGSSDILIAVIDTGIDLYHPDLAKNIAVNLDEISLNSLDDDKNSYIDDVVGWDMAGDGNQPDADPMDVDGHGTHVAGIIAAMGNNGRGGAGLNWSAGIIPLKVQADGSSTMEDVHIIDSLYYALSRNVRIVNCSYGGGADSYLEQLAIEALGQAGILVVCAAGNDGIDTDITPNYPSAYNLDNIISVAAGDSGDNLAYYSNYGTVSVDVMAPGSYIKSTIPTSTPTQANISVVGGPVNITADAMTHAGFTDAAGISGTLVDCGKGNDDSDFPAWVNGNIAFIQRGVETFENKTRLAQNAGAIAVIIYNNESGSVLGTLGIPGDWIPVVSITDIDGGLLAGQLGETVTLINQVVDSDANYGYNSGTSMAAPQVTGIAALLLSVNPQLDAAGLKSAIMNTVDVLPALSGKMISSGRVNALAALCSVTGTTAGDLSGDGQLGLDDTILAMQIISAQFPSFSSCAIHKVDADGNGRIGMADAMYILQKISGLRE